MTHHFQLHFNIAAPPFKPPPNYNAYPTIRIGPSKLPVNGKIWGTIANDRILPALPKNSRVGSALLSSMSLPTTPALPPSFFNSSNVFGGYVSSDLKFFCKSCIKPISSFADSSASVRRRLHAQHCLHSQLRSHRRFRRIY